MADIFEPTDDHIQSLSVEKEIQSSFLDYAMSVIVSRALPDVRDGLKPVHRRILYAMHDVGLQPSKPHKKSAGVVGEVLKKYHPHGDSAVYDTMVRMAQPWALRYPLVDGHGNFGSIDGDSAAAYRYTEARLSKIATEMLADIDKDTVDFVPNFDGEETEPTVLPARIPNLLMNGSGGIAVGMATNIPPHNLRELVDACLLVVEKMEVGSDNTVSYDGVTLEELMKKVRGPDFPTGGIILGKEGIRQAYTTGRGKVLVRGVAEIEEGKSGKYRIVITEVPYQVNKAAMIERMAELVREKKLDGITDIRDESNREGMRVVIELRRDAHPQVVLNKIYKMTSLQNTFGIINLALVKGQPRELSLKEMLTHYLDHRRVVLRRRTEHELRKAQERAHILEGLLIALQDIDGVIALIKASRDADQARTGLMEKYKLSEIQASAILEMRLSRLTALETKKLQEEYAELQKRIAELQAILADERKILELIREDLTDVREKYGDARRTRIQGELGEFDEEDLIQEEEVVVTVTQSGYIKRTPLSTYRSQHRGGKGIKGLTTRGEDVVNHLCVSNTHHFLLFFTNKGKCYRIKTHEVPVGSRIAKGIAAVNVLKMDSEETIQAIIPLKDFDEAQGKFLLMATTHGMVKKTALSEYNSRISMGLIAMRLKDGDDLCAVAQMEKDNDVILATRDGLSIRFSSEQARPLSRDTQGVSGIDLRAGDMVIGMALVNDDLSLLVVSNRGMGKLTRFTEYRRQNRGGKGLITMKTTPKVGKVLGIALAEKEDELIIITKNGILNRQKLKDIRNIGRNTQGVKLINLGEGDEVMAIDVTPPEEDDTEGG